MTQVATPFRYRSGTGARKVMGWISIGPKDCFSFPSTRSRHTMSISYFLVYLLNLKGNSGVKMKLFWMFDLGTMFQFLIILFTNSFLQLRYFT